MSNRLKYALAARGMLQDSSSTPVDYSNLRYSKVGLVGERLGFYVSISNTRAVVGAYLGSSGGGNAYVYDLSTGALSYTIANPNAQGATTNDQFGYRVDISESYIIVSAPEEDTSNYTSTGTVYVFDVSDGSLIYTFLNPSAYGSAQSDRFGKSVAVHGNYALIGTDQEDSANGNASGAAYLFDLTTGSLIRTILNPNPYDTAASDLFGFSCDINGSYYIIGAYGEDEIDVVQSGKAYVYDLASGDLLYTLDNPGAQDGSLSGQDYFGYNVKLSDTHAIVSAHREYAEDGTTSFSGRVYVYELATGSLVYTFINPNVASTAASDTFGFSVDITADYAIVGAPAEDYGGTTNAGVAYIYDLSDGSLAHTIYNFGAGDDTSAASDQYGYSVAISDAGAIVGAPFEDDSGTTNNGAVYIYG